MEHRLGRIAQIHVSVSDLDRSVAFYRDVLGLPHLFTVPGQPMAFLDAGGVRLYLGVPEDKGFRSRPLIYFAVDGLEETYDAVVARGAEALGPPHKVHSDGTTDLFMAFVADPDGTPIGLMEERPA